jgi:hypothetical protein
MGKLILVWQGLAKPADRIRIKGLFDRSAIDLGAAVRRGAHARSIIAVAPIIAQCRLAHKKNRIVRGMLLFVMAALLISLFFVLFGCVR